ncbi:MAG: SprT family zinc-dependent metalloprotease [Bilophila sp.]
MNFFSVASLFSPAEPALEELHFRGETIAFFIHKGTRRRKRLAIRVTRDGQVDVLVPPRSSRKEALWAVESRGEWILHHVRAAKARPQASPLCYTHGETHWFLGQPRVLDVATPVPCLGRGQTRVQLDPSGERLLVRLNDKTPEAVQKALRIWYRAEALRILSERLKALCTSIPWLAAVPPMQVKAMRRRWGSCTIRGELTLNTHLVKAPFCCIDYVLLHELAHVREHNHSKRYYAVLEQLLPEWKTVRSELETLAPLLLNR